MLLLLLPPSIIRPGYIMDYMREKAGQALYMRVCPADRVPSLSRPPVCCSGQYDETAGRSKREDQVVIICFRILFFSGGGFGRDDGGNDAVPKPPDDEDR